MPVADEVSISYLDQVHRWERHALDSGAGHAHPAILALAAQRMELVVEVANAVLAADNLADFNSLPAAVVLSVRP